MVKSYQSAAAKLPFTALRSNGKLDTSGKKNIQVGDEMLLTCLTYGKLALVQQSESEWHLKELCGLFVLECCCELIR